jgi:hypothetical protein
MGRFDVDQFARPNRSAIIYRDGPQLAPDLVVLSYVVNDAVTHLLTVASSTAPAWVPRIRGVFMGPLQIETRAGETSAHGFMSDGMQSSSSWMVSTVRGPNPSFTNAMRR